MKISVDLHAHSPYAGATGKVDFERLHFVMKRKGIDVYGSGDILLGKWERELDSAFEFDNSMQMWRLPDKLYLMPQTEVIITMPYLHNPSKRKLFHLVILFSKREEIEIVKKAFLKKESKLTIGRPFVKFDSMEEMQNVFKELKEKTDILLIPAHVMTPEGILGGKNPVDSLEDLFGRDLSIIDALESGLSADPAMLAAISNKTDIPIISSSDSHSAAFNKLGREFSQLEVDQISSSGVVNSIKDKKIVQTVEFPPTEGRYYLTGHRDDRPGHDGKGIFFEEKRPDKCPVCGKGFTPGVRERIETISGKSDKVQPFVYQIPLIEIIAKTLNCGVKTKRAEKLYIETVSKAGKESNIWLENMDDDLKKAIPEDLYRSIKRIKENDFKIVPGFDGQYGSIEF